MAVLPAGAEMFGPDYQPCGDKPSTLAIVECVQAKNQNIGSAVERSLQGAAGPHRRRSASTAAGGATAVGPVSGRQLRVLRSTGRVNPAGAGSRVYSVDDGGPGAGTRKGDDVRLGGVRGAMRSYRLSKTHTPVTSIAARCITVYRELSSMQVYCTTCRHAVGQFGTYG